MKRLREKILREGKNLGDGILKVDSFLNHQIDPELIREAGRHLALRFAHYEPTKILTAEVSGIAPAIATALILNIPLIYARKVKPVTMFEKAYCQKCPSHTKGQQIDLLVSPEVLGPQEKVLIVDDFLASGLTLQALGRIVEESGSRVAGFGVIIEKDFEGGRKLLESFNAPIESLVVIKEMKGDSIVIG